MDKQEPGNSKMPGCMTGWKKEFQDVVRSSGATTMQWVQSEDCSRFCNQQMERPSSQQLKTLTYGTTGKESERKCEQLRNARKSLVFRTGDVHHDRHDHLIREIFHLCRVLNHSHEIVRCDILLLLRPHGANKFRRFDGSVKVEFEQSQLTGNFNWMKLNK